MGRPARAARRPGSCASRSAGGSTPTAGARAARPGAGAAPLPTASTAVAVCLLHADLEPGPRAGGGGARCAARASTCRARRDVSPEFREYERTVTTVVNAYLRPVCRPYLERLDGARRRGAGDDVGRRAGRRSARPPTLPAALLLSGPAGGVRAGAAVAAACGYPDAVTLRHGRHQHRRVPGPGRRARAGAGPRGGRASRPPAGARHPHHRRRRRLDRPPRPGRRADGRPRER